MAFSFISEQLAERKEQHLYRKSTALSGRQSRLIAVDNKQYLNFSSNDYLGLAAEPELVNAWKKGADLFGVGSGGSYLVTGYNQVHHDVTQQLQEWLGLDALCLFNSGYSANQAIIKLLLNKNDLLLQDKLNHASLMEAGSYSPVSMQRFKHNDMQHLANLLDKHKKVENKLIVTEGVFSMDGDQSPLQLINRLSKDNKAWLMVDDAHGIGVLGEDGKGSLNTFQMNNNECDIYMATFGKALGVGGALISGSTQLIDYITNFSKPYIYTTGMPPAMIYCIGKAAKLTQVQQWRRDKLSELICYFKQKSNQLDIPLMSSDTAIQPVLIGSSAKALTVASHLKANGCWVTAIRPPTVPNNAARLRVTLTTNHTKQDIAFLVKQIKQALDANSH